MSEARLRDERARVRVDDAAGLGGSRVDAPMQRQRLARRARARRRVAGGVDPDERRRIEVAEARVGRGDEEAVVQARAQVAGRAVHVAARMERAADAAQLVAKARLAHERTLAQRAVPPSGTERPLRSGRAESLMSAP